MTRQFAPACATRGSLYHDAPPELLPRRRRMMMKIVKKTTVVKRNAARSCGNGLPRQPIPAGCFLVHNHVKPTSKLGMNGFRTWIQEGRGDLVQCRCEFGGCKNAELHKHHRVLALTLVPLKKQPRRGGLLRSDSRSSLGKQAKTFVCVKDVELGYCRQT